MKIREIALLLAFATPPSIGATAAPSTDPAQAAASGAVVGAGDLEREKFAYQKMLEEKKLEVERLKAWLTGGSILIPLVLGVITLGWQSYTAAKLKDREAKDAFELKAVEIVFAGDNTRATKNKAKALTTLFPARFPANFGDAFEPTQFGGPRYDAKLEVFKAACSKVQSPDEVYRIWHEIFPGDKWIEPLVGTKPPAGDSKQLDIA